MLDNMDSRVAIIAGAYGQDGYFLTEQLLREGWFVHAIARELTGNDLRSLPGDLNSRLQLHQIDLLKPQPLFDLIREIQPEELYNLAGQSSVSKSFLDPLYTWQTNT